MGQLKHDGKATQGGVTFPAGTITFGDLYRVDGWTGVALKSIASGDTVRTADMEISSERIWYVKVPAITAAKGDMLYWSSGSGFKRGDTDLVVEGTSGAIGPACKVEEAKDSNGYAAVRIFQTKPS